MHHERVGYASPMADIPWHELTPGRPYAQLWLEVRVKIWTLQWGNDSAGAANCRRKRCEIVKESLSHGLRRC